MGYCQLNEGKKLQVNFTMKDLRFSCNLVFILHYFLTSFLFILVLYPSLLITCYDS
jgi:hypothetical protein